MNVYRLKALVKKEVARSGASPQSVYDAFFFESFLRRLSLSEYRNSFVLKGGFFLESILGISNRTTLDIDLKAEGLVLDDKELIRVMKSICSISAEDGIHFEIVGISDIAAKTKYGGKKVKVEARLDNLVRRFSIDVAEGDSVTPYPDEYEYSPLMEGSVFTILSYNKETVLAEKFEALFSRGLENSRAKDLFDICILMKENLDVNRLNAAIINTFHERGTELDKAKMRQTLMEIQAFPYRRKIYENHAKKTLYANKFSFDEAMDSAFKILESLNEGERMLPREGTSITIVRHGEDDKIKVGGWSDNKLTEKGKGQMKTLAQQLGNRYDIIISSDLPRAKESAEILNETLHCPIIYDEGLREIDNGDYKDLPFAEFAKGNYRKFVDLGMDEPYPNGESPSSFFERVKLAYKRILKEYGGKRIIIVTHAGVITCIECLNNGYAYSNLLRISPHYAEKIDLPSEISPS